MPTTMTNLVGQIGRSTSPSMALLVTKAAHASVVTASAHRRRQ